MKREYVTIFVIMVTEILGFSLILPFLPLMAQDLGLNELQIGLILTVFSFFQFFSAPILGRLSDFYGRKFLLVISQISTALSFVILGFANSLWMLLFSRTVDGAVGSNYTISQAYLSDISSVKNRTRALAVGEIAFAVGLIVSPVFGGLLAVQKGYSFPAFLAAGMSGTSILMTLFLLKEPKNKQLLKKNDIWGLKNFTKYFQIPEVRNLMIRSFLYLVVQSLFVFTFALFANQRVGANAFQIGILLTSVGLISVLVRVLMVMNLMDFVSEKSLTWVSFWLMIIGLAVAMVQASWLWFLLGLGLFVIGSGWYRPLLMGAISKKVSEHEQGTIMGVANSLSSITQVIGPILGGAVLYFLSPLWFLIIGVGVLLLSLLFKE